MNMNELIKRLGADVIADIAKETLGVEAVHDIRRTRVENVYSVLVAGQTHTYTKTIEIFFNGVELMGAVYRRVRTA